MSDAGVFLDKARESLESAEDDFAKQRYNVCARNAYYAAFQAAVAALLIEGIRPSGQWSHDFVRAEFAGRLIYRRKVYDSSYRAVLMEAAEKRVDADYTTRSLRERDVNKMMREIRGLVAAVEARLRGDR